MHDCYISFGLMAYEPKLAWTAAAIVFIVCIAIGFACDLNKHKYAALFAILVGVIVFIALMVFGLTVKYC